MKDALGYVAMASGVVAAMMVSLNFSRRITGYGFAVFLVSSLVWIAYGLIGSDPALVIQNGILFLINILGVYRWLILKEKP